MNKQNELETEENSVTSMEKPVRNRRSAEEKVGRLKYNQVLLKRVLSKLVSIEATQRVILNGLKGAGYFHFDVPMIQKFSCRDAIDLAIMERVRETGVKGIFPYLVAKGLSQYSLHHYDVSRRILRMNKRMACETGEAVFEKHGHKWGLTRFALDVYGETEAELGLDERTGSLERVDVDGGRAWSEIVKEPAK